MASAANPSLTLSQLSARIKTVAYLEGDFTLSSGRKSSYIIDKYLFETDPLLLRTIAVEVARRLPGGVARLAGIELGGVPLATAVALETGLPFVIVKKAAKGYGTDRLVEGILNPGDPVVLVEDVLTTGQQALRGAHRLVQAGALVKLIFAIVDRQEGARQAIEAAGFALVTLFTRSSLGIQVG